jgi:hypothetical protein
VPEYHLSTSDVAGLLSLVQMLKINSSDSVF